MTVIIAGFTRTDQATTRRRDGGQFSVSTPSEDECVQVAQWEPDAKAARTALVPTPRGSAIR